MSRHLHEDPGRKATIPAGGHLPHPFRGHWLSGIASGSVSGSCRARTTPCPSAHEGAPRPIRSPGSAKRQTPGPPLRGARAS